MYEDFRTCSECGKKKHAKEFWREAKRCRKCVARATGKLRAERSKEWKSHVKKAYDLSLALSERRVGKERCEARRVAESKVPQSGRDIWARWLSIYAGFAVVLGSAGIAFFLTSPNGHLIGWASIFANASAFVTFGVAERLRAPRYTAVCDLTNVLLRERLKLVEAELMEYQRFYTTPDWRVLRGKVIKRDGRICQKCGAKIDRMQDLTVDHIRPRSLYPQLALDPNNLQVLCRSCNSSKGVSVETEL